MSTVKVKKATKALQQTHLDHYHTGYDFHSNDPVCF